MLILRTLLTGPAHGHQIAKHLQHTTSDVLQVEHSSLHPALHRLERKGCLASKWEAKDKQVRAQILSPSALRQEATRGGGIEVEANGQRHRASDLARARGWGELRPSCLGGREFSGRVEAGR